MSDEVAEPVGSGRLWWLWPPKNWWLALSAGSMPGTGRWSAGTPNYGAGGNLGGATHDGGLGNPGGGGCGGGCGGGG
ncbi:hypothetical protein JDV09_15265 [Mycobacterium sp. Y57]|uniref:hypothetical protein n=1 Tax=Mycolicibacterium xanthum TaxID=2796469 RepID=UPI001C841A06|nr:hypothetical protein [Mycolicibacterium xanthum]MBX7433459.1 hypothetical protein [Mycolicibacterium xanthum]